MGAGDGLATHLGLTCLDATPQTGDEGVTAFAIDPASALDEYLRLRVRALPVRMAGRIFGVLAQTVPGVRDIVIIGKCVHESSLSTWDSVIVDGQPTGQIESVLSAPAVIQELSPKGRVHDQAKSLSETLADPILVGIVVVATAEQLALTEATEFVTAAGDSGLTPRLRLIANRVLSAPGFESVPDTDGPATDAAHLHLELLAAQEQLLGDAVVQVRLPFVFGADGPASVAFELAGFLAS
jgi:anion-transporting  ArsA/GET3 family ATPase